MSTNKSKSVKFNANEGLAYDDMNKVQDAMTARAWEYPDYADLFPHVQGPGVDYDTQFNAATGLTHMTFVKSGMGPYLKHASGFTCYLLPGFIGIYSGTAPPIAVTPKMQWVQVDGFESFVHTAAPGGTLRYDYIVMTVAETSTDNETRHFKDSTTGAKTSTTTAKRKSLTATFSIRAGTAAGSPTLPTLSAGEHAIAMVKVSPAAVIQCSDLTWPMGQTRIVTHMPMVGSMLGSTPEAFGRGLIASGGLDAVGYFFPPFMGDPGARLVALEIDYNTVDAPTIASLQRWDWGTHDAQKVDDGGTGGGEDIQDLTSSLPSGSHVVRIDLRGPPFTDVDRGPFWGNGNENSGERTRNPTPVIFASGLMLKLAISNAGGKIIRVTWLYAR